MTCPRCRAAVLVEIGASFAGSTAKTAKPSHKASASTARYECTHCNIQMSAKEAKAHEYKCDCGAKLTLVKKPAKSKKA